MSGKELSVPSVQNGQPQIYETSSKTQKELKKTIFQEAQNKKGSPKTGERPAAHFKSKAQLQKAIDSGQAWFGDKVDVDGKTYRVKAIFTGSSGKMLYSLETEEQYQYMQDIADEQTKALDTDG